MDKYTKKPNYNILMVDVLVICTIAVYTFFSQKQIEEYAQYIVEQSCEDFSEKMDMSVSSAINSIQQTSHLVSRTMSGTVLENANDVLDLFIEQSPFEFIEYIEQDSTNTTDKGEKFDAGDRVYYEEGIAGNTGVWINYHPQYSNEYLLNFYTPLYYQEQVVGVLTGAMGADTNVLPLMENNFLGEEMISILCDENGQIIASTVNTDGDTYLEDLLVKLGVTQETQQVFYNQLDKKIRLLLNLIVLKESQSLV